MKLNSDCIRAVMLKLEDMLSMESDDRHHMFMRSVRLEELCDAVPRFSPEDVFYSLHNLEQAGYVELTTQYADGGILMYCYVDDITFLGHEFLNRIRDAKHWTTIKACLAKVQDYSLSAISSIAEGVTKAAMDKYLGSMPL